MLLTSPDVMGPRAQKRTLGPSEEDLSLGHRSHPNT